MVAMVAGSSADGSVTWRCGTRCELERSVKKHGHRKPPYDNSNRVSKSLPGGNAAAHGAANITAADVTSLGLLSLSLEGLDIVVHGGSADEKRWAELIIPVRKKGNKLLCTLLLGNTLVNALIAIISADLTVMAKDVSCPDEHQSWHLWASTCQSRAGGGGLRWVCSPRRAGKLKRTEGQRNATNRDTQSKRTNGSWCQRE